MEIDRFSLLALFSFLTVINTISLKSFLDYGGIYSSFHKKSNKIFGER